MAKIPVTVLVPVKDEELNIVQCLRSVSWADQIFVIDSHSTDRTAEFAARLGADVRQFDYTGGWPKKKNWALENLPIRNEWVFLLDADEWVPDELRDEIASIVDENGPIDGYCVRFRVYFLGRWIRHSSLYPTWVMRLFRRDKGRFEKVSTAPGSGDVELHENVILRGTQGYLRHDYIHEDLKDIHHFLEKHNRYSTWEVQAVYDVDSEIKSRPRFFGTPSERRRWLKRLFVRMPFRPIIKFLWMYVIRLGFLDGRPGFIFSVLLSQHEFHIAVKQYERSVMAEKWRRAQLEAGAD